MHLVVCWLAFAAIVGRFAAAAWLLRQGDWLPALSAYTMTASGLSFNH